MSKPIQVTQKALEALKKELSFLVEEKRPQVVDRLENARQEGDLKENSDYQAAKEALEFLDGKIEELRHVVENAEVIQANGSSGNVGVGTRVQVKVGSTEHEFEIVGEWEADPAEKKISHTSPLGQALLNKKKGDTVEVEAPAGRVVYEIVSIA